MDNEKIDIELIAALALEISDRYKTMLILFSSETDKLLKHLASSSIHMVFFMRDIKDYSNDEKSPSFGKLETEFLENCGCKVKNDNS